jgi:hypothetical protein
MRLPPLLTHPLRLLVATWLLLAPAPAHAAPRGGRTPHGTRNDKEQAAALVDEGITQFEAGDYQGALDHFQSAYEIYASPKILLNIAGSLKRLGREAEAADTYHRFLGETVNSNEVSDEKKRVAREALDELRKSLARIQLEVDPPSTVVTIDGNPIKEPAGRTIHLDAGTHVLNARADGFEPKVVTLTVVAGEQRRVPILLGPEGIAPVSAHPNGGGSHHVGAIATAGLSAALLITGVIAGSSASSAFDDLRKTTSPAEFDQLRGAVQTRSTVANVAFVAGGVAAVASVILFLVDGDHASGAQVNARTRIAPELTVNGYGLVIQGHF